MRDDSRIDMLISAWEQGGCTRSPEELCAECPDLLGQVRERLSVLGAVDRLLQTATPSPVPPDIPLAIPNYDIVGLLGEGGMGTVWRAVQRTTHRSVALKAMSAASFGSERARRRFEREVELTARLEHPNIARLYDSGTHQGVCFYAMELIDGLALDAYVAEQKLDRRQIIELMRRICQAVQHAHQRGIIHRDLKPSNILVTSDGEPHVLDFGLARTLLRDPDEPAVTVEGDLAGTPAYMSPEQAAGKAASLDTRTDVYTLGVILYELLTGGMPHGKSGSHLEILRRIAEDEPQRPRAANPKLDDDVDSLLLKALAREPDYRYASAGELANDLKSYLGGEPLTAQPPTTFYFLRKRMKKYWGRVAVGVAIMLLLIGMAGLTPFAFLQRRAAILNAQRAITNEKQAREAETRAQQSAKEANLHLEERARSERTSQERLAQALIASGDSFARSNRFVEARQSYTEAGDVLHSLGLCELPATTGLYNTYIEGPAPLIAIDEGAALVRRARFASDGRTVLAVGGKGVTLWDFRLGIRSKAFMADGVTCAALAPDCATLLTGGSDNLVRVWDVATGRESRRFAKHTANVAQVKSIGVAQIKSVAFVRDGTTAVTADNATVEVWNISTGRYICSARVIEPDDALLAAVPSPDSAAFLALSIHAIKLWDASNGNEVRALSTAKAGWSIDAAFSPNGQYAVTLHNNDSLRLWDVATGREVRRFHGHEGNSGDVAFSPDGNAILSGGGHDNLATLWDVSTGSEIRNFGGHSDRVAGVAFSPDGEVVLTTDGTSIRLWKLAVEKRAPSLSHEVTYRTGFSPDGRLAVTGGPNGSLCLWDVPTGKLLNTFGTSVVQVPAIVAFAPDGKSALTGGNDNSLLLWNLADGTVLHKFAGHTLPVGAFAFSPDGTTILSGSEDRSLRLWSVETGKEIRCLTHHTRAVYSGAVAFCPDGKKALSGDDYSVNLWDVTTGRLIRTFKNPNGPGIMITYTIACSPDGKTAISAGNEKDLQLWDIGRGELIRTFAGHQDGIADVAYSPDGRTVISGSNDGTFRLWEAPSGKEIRSYTGHSTYGAYKTRFQNVCSVAFSSDGKTFLTDDCVNTREWDLSRPVRYREMAANLAKAQKVLQTNASDPAAWAAFGEWYAFRGKDDWAIELLEKARAGGAAVDPLTLARCYWKLSDEIPARSPFTRDACVAGARREFANALDQSKDEGLKWYLRLCIKALNEIRTTPTNPDASRIAELLASVSSLEKLAEASPENEEYRIKLAVSYRELYLLQGNAGQREESLHSARRALDLREKLASAKPGDLDRQSLLGGSYNNFGIALAELGKPRDALQNYQSAIQHQQIAFDAAPTVGQYRRFLRNHYANMANAHLTLKEPADAMAAAMKCVELLPHDPDNLFAAGRQLGKCAAVLGDKNKDLSPQDQAARRKYVDLAIQTLRQSLEAGHAQRDLLKTDVAFDSIRDEPEFKKLMSERPTSQPMETPGSP